MTKITTTIITATVPIRMTHKAEQQLFDVSSSYQIIQNYYSKRLFESFGQQLPDNASFRRKPKTLKNGKVSPGYQKLKKTLDYEVRALPIVQGALLRTLAFQSVIARYATVNANKHTLKKPIHFKAIGFESDWRTGIKQTGKSIHGWAGKAHEFYQQDAYNEFSISYPGKQGEWINVKADIRPWQHDLLNRALKFSESKIYYSEYNKQWYMGIPVQIENNQPQDTFQTVVGMDLGINHMVTLTDTNNRNHFVRGHEIKEQKRKYILKKTELQKVGTRSAKRLIQKIGKREHRWQTDINHSVTRELINTYGENTLFILEDLSGRGLQKKLQHVQRHNRRLQKSWAYHQFKEQLTYKAALAGAELLFVDPKDTSTTCSKCGYCSKNNYSSKPNRMKCRSCQYEVNGDLNAARNILSRGLDKAVSKKLITANQFHYPTAKDGSVLDGILNQWTDKDIKKSS